METVSYPAASRVPLSRNYGRLLIAVAGNVQSSIDNILHTLTSDSECSFQARRFATPLRVWFNSNEILISCTNLSSTRIAKLFQSCFSCKKNFIGIESPPL